MINITDKKNCCGCASCIQRCPQGCISLKEDNEGFLYPRIDTELCTDCGVCEKVCPVINPADARRPLKTFASRNRNQEIRAASSSGGIFHPLASKTISEGGVVFGARFDPGLNVVHDYAQTEEEISKFMGSKYIQSRIGDSFIKAEEFLKSGRKVLFSGTPCQIAGLRLFLGKEYENLLAVDIVCHGVPSPMVWSRYLSEVFKPGPDESVEINFRDKRRSWKKYSFTAEKDGSAILSEPFTGNTYMKGFLQDLYLRSSCYKCPARSLRSGSDITLGDYWGIESILPALDDDKGASLCMINSPAGESAFSDIGAESVETSYSQAVTGNPWIERSTRIPSRRKDFWKDFYAGRLSMDVLVAKHSASGLRKRAAKILRKFRRY